MNGSLFPEDNNNEYRFKKINEIQDLAEKEVILILQNLNQIQPYLYDLYNMSYKIIDEQKFVRICLENLSEQDTPVNDSLRIIILVDRQFINSVDIAFLNRLEKMQINFKDLLDEEKSISVKNIIKEIALNDLNKKKLNYDLDNLLINCSEEDINGLYYNISVEEDDKKKVSKKDDKEKIEEAIKKKIYSKICNLLPQDIIANVKDGKIKEQYYKEKRYCNFDEYKKDLLAWRKANKNNYKISIIYTFSNLGRNIHENEFLISEIRSENQLKSRIDEILIKNKNIEDYGKIIIINFEQSNSDKIQFVSDYIMNYYNKDNYNYIFIVHIKRMFFNDNQSYQRIYSIPNINEEINQIFIDNLNGPSNITLKDLLMQNIKGLILSNNKNLIDEEMEFKNSLSNFVYNQRNERDKIDILNNPIGEDYLLKLRRYMENNKDFRKKLIEKAKELNLKR